jgi:hAT family C-terminal dimerisation region
MLFWVISLSIFVCRALVLLLPPFCFLLQPSSPFQDFCFFTEQCINIYFYALEVLACPAASIFSERVFSTAGAVITDKRGRLSTANVDKLTFIKMNQTWMPQDLSVPCAE